MTRVSELRRGIPLWLGLERNAHRQRYPRLDRDLSTDVVVVGGGLTGAVLALTFVKAGISVVLLEADGIGHGSTAASSALLMHEPDRDFGELAKSYGGRAARRIWHLCVDATRAFIETLQELGIDCDLVQRDAVYFTMDSHAVNQLHAEHRRRRAGGVGGRWLDGAELRRITGISGAAGIRSRDNAQLNPYRACLGLLRSAAQRGAHIFEHSAVRRIENTKAGVLAITRGGRVSARNVLIATGYATSDFRPLSARFEIKHTYVLATSQIPKRAQRKLRLGDLLLWDTERPYHYARWFNRRLIMGGGDRPQVTRRQRGRAFEESVRDLRQHFERLLPPLGDIEIEDAWEGLFASTPDGLPYIGPHHRYPRHLFALGYGGNGMTFSFLAGRLLLEWFTRRPSADCQLFAFDRRPASL
jgi:glycine/D-amino acid oxidase-like deaminating enzyme